MRLLITGGLGFVGTNMMPYVLKDQSFSQVTVLDNLRYTANPECVPNFSKNPKFNFIEGDIRDEALVQKLVAEHDMVIHLAAETFVDKSIAGSRIFYEVNVLGTLNLFESLRRSPVNKVVHVSTDEVWGEATNGTAFREQTAYNPRNPYAASKAAADHIVRSYGTTYGIPYNIVHFTNLYGPWQYPEKLIPVSIVRLLEGQKIRIHGDGTNIRMWLHVEDSTRGLLSVLKDAPTGESYALGSHDEIANIDVAHMILDALHKPETDITFVKDRPGNDLRYAVDYTKIHEALGWQPQVDFQDGLTDKVQWFQKHPEWWCPRSKER
jgi:dTDP-glucose 4,6-dehydratase